jgi:hypothetical protein
MAQKQIGIRQNTIQVRISGARVAFDPRTTAEVRDTLDDKNYKAAEKGMRTRLWEEREAERRAHQRREAAE